MSETTPEATPADPNPALPDPADAVAATTPADEPETGKGNKEAATYRRRLRETEVERDTLAGQLDAARRREVARLASARLDLGTDLLDLGGTDLADLLDDAGAVDEDKVALALAALLAARPSLDRKRYAPPTPGQGQPSTPDSAGWAQVFGR